MHTAKRFVSSLMVIALSLQFVPLQALAIEDGAPTGTPEAIVQEPAAPVTDAVAPAPATDAQANEDGTDTVDSGVAVIMEPVEQPASEVATVSEAAPEVANSTQLPRADLLRKLGSLRLPKDNTKDREPYVRDEVLVKFKEKIVNLATDTGKAAARAFADAQRLDLDSTIVASNIVVLRTRDGETVPAAIARLRWIPEVLHAQPNFVYQPLSNDPRFDDLWALQPGVMDAATAWEKNEGDGIVVAVIDSGVAFNHPDLKDNMWDGTNCLNDAGQEMGGCDYGYDFDADDPTPFPVDSSHGTHVAGTIGAIGNNTGIIGVSPKVRIMALRVALPASDTDQIIRAVNFAAFNGADVVNMSIGGQVPLGSEMSQSDILLKRAIDDHPDILFAVSAGNGGVDGVGDEHGVGVDAYPCDYDSTNIICVAATDQADKLASFSDYGETSVDVGAPGTNILSTVPGSTTSFSEDFESVVPPSVGSKLSVGSADVWSSFKFSDGDTALVAIGESAGIEASAVTSSPIDISAYNNAILSFFSECAINVGDAAVLQFWDGIKWGDFVDVLIGDIFDQKKYPINLSTTDFQFRIFWNDVVGDVSPSFCIFDDFLISALDDGTSEQYAYNAGTSMAAPHVAGVAALVKGYNKNIAMLKLKEIILDTGDDLPLAEDRDKIASGKRVNAANALNVFEPHVGLTAEDVLGAGGHSLEGESVKFNFVVKDGVADLPFTLKQFEYSTDGGTTWQAPTNGDASEAIPSFSLDGRTTVTSFPTGSDFVYAIFFNANHADLTGFSGVDQDDVRIRFKANDGAVDSPFAVSAAFAVDLLAPTAALSGTPAALTNATGATITVGGDDVVSYRYALDGGAFTETASLIAEPLALSGLTEGAHTLRVIAKDDVGNEQAIAAATTFTWTVDTTPGTALLTNKPDVRTNQTGATFMVGGEDVATYTYQLDGGPASEPAAVMAVIELTNLAEGSHTIAVTGIDAPGNTQAQPTTYTWIIDTSPAVPTISGVPSDPTNLTSATLTIGGEDIVLYRFSLDGGAFGGDSPVGGVTLVETPIILAELTDGTHTVRVIGRDSIGNWQAEANAVTVTWTVDTIAPTLTETTPVATPTNDTTPGPTITVENGAAWEVLRGETVLASGTGTGAAQSVVLSELTDGIYTLTLAATDAVENRATLTLTAFVVDTASPVGISLRDVPVSPTNATTATVTIVAGDDIVAYRFALDSDAFGNETAVANPIALSGLADGTHTLRVIGRDAAGNWMPENIAITATWSVDTVPPTTTLTNLPRAETPGTVANITVGGTGVVAYRFSLDGGAFGNEALVETPIALRNLADGAHTIRVIGRDAVGNFQDEASAATFSWVVDRSLAVPPTANPASGALTAQRQIRFFAPLAENMHYVYENPETLSCTTGSSMNTGGEIFVDRATTIHVVACYAGGVPSAVTSFTYTFATTGGGGGGGGGGAPSFIFSSPAPTARAVESVAPSAAPTAPAIVAAPAILGGQVLGVREFASGTLLRVDERDMFLVSGIVLHKIPSSKALWRYRDRERINVTRADTTGYTDGVSVLELRASTTNVGDARTVASGTLLRVDGGDIFLVEGTTLRRVPNLEVLWRYRGRQRVEARSSVLDRFHISAPLT